MPYVNIDWDDISTREIIDELENRWLSPDEQSNILECIKTDGSEKLKYFMSIMAKYSLTELQQLFKEEISAKAGPNQIQLL